MFPLVEIDIYEHKYFLPINMWYYTFVYKLLFMCVCVFLCDYMYIYVFTYNI